MPKVEVEKLLEGLTLTEDQKKVFVEAYSDEKNNEAAAERYMMRSDYSRAQDELRRQEAEAKAKYDESEAYRQTLAEWQESEKQRLAGEKQTWEAERVRLQTELVTKGADPSQFRPPDPPAPKVPDTADYDKRYLGVDTARSIAQTAIELPLKMPVIMARYQQLYGHINADWNGFQEIAKNNLLTKGVPVEDSAAQFFKFPEQEQKLAAEELERKTTQMADDKFRELMSQAQIPGAQLNQHISTDKMFTSDFADKSVKMTPDITEHERPETIDAALQDFLKVNAELEQQGVHMLR